VFKLHEIRSCGLTPAQAISTYGFAVMTALALGERGSIENNAPNIAEKPSMCLSSPLELLEGEDNTRKEIRILLRNGSEVHIPLCYTWGDEQGEEVSASIVLRFGD
jgi:hypothetical protein